MEKIIFIDRDGVINVDPIGDYIKAWKDFRFEKGAIEGLQKIAKLGYEIILISNQAGIGDGIYPVEALWDIQEHMLEELRKNGVMIRSSHFCLHGKQEGCSCRKPQIGLFEAAVRGIEFDPQKTFFIGDKGTDVEAGKRFGIRTIMVMTGHGKFDFPNLRFNQKPDFIAENLNDAVQYLT